MRAFHHSLICLDIETVPDTDAMPPGTDPDDFPKLPYHKVVAVSMVEAEIVRSAAEPTEWYRVTDVRSGGREEYGEDALLKGFWAWFGKRCPRVVTWNGRGFDLPVLRLRAMVHGISAGAWHKAGDGRFSGYSHRYSTDWHCDLADVLADHGAARMIGLDDMARAMGLPGKIGGHGSEVADMVRAGQIGRVRDYCEGDVLNLFCLYVRWALLAGRCSPDGHNASFQSLVDYLARERPGRPHLGEFLDRWGASARPSPMMVPVPGLPGVADRPHLPSEEVLP